ncbi:MAG: Ig-like domain-containing protein [Mariprofundus sp.]|nr:Ig-like domain-containing protein [Mariprofundus sp.]
MKLMYAFLILVLPLLGLSGCGQTSGDGAPVATGLPTFVANFDPNNSIIPFPDDLLFTGSLDGTLNIPVVNPADFSDPKVAMNALDGFSTIAPISTTFATAANAATIIAGTTLHVYEVTATRAGAVTGIVRELTAAEYTATLSGTTTLVIQPRAVLKSNTRYMVVLTGGIRSTSGLPLVPSSTFGLTKGTAPLVDAAGKSLFAVLTDAQAQALEPLRQLTQTYLAAAAGAGVPSSAVALAWTFKTQTINNVLANIQADSVATAALPANFVTFPVPPSPATGGLGVLSMAAFAAANGLPIALFPNVGSVVIGAIKIPYYLSTDGAGVGGGVGVPPTVLPGAVTAHFTIDPATGLPTPNPLPETVPFLMTTPNTAGPWPVVIFQHGFTVDKSVVFGIANTLAKAGFASIAIDSVLHGDRTFGIDLVTQAVDPVTGKATGPVIANVPDGVADSSGQWYLNLSYLLTFRDNIRQSVADLIHMTRLLEVQTMDVVVNATGAPGADGLPDLLVNSAAAPAAPPISYVGHSNGGILGTMLAAVEPAIKTFVLANPGGVYSDIALHSAEISPIVLAGLAAKGVLPGSPEFNAFFVAAQTALDDGDPVNYAGIAAAPAATKNLLMFKQLGDLVVPNTATDALAASFGMKQVAASPAAATWPLGVVPSPFMGNGFTFFTKGTHSSFLKPDPPAPSLIGVDVITEMQTETATYLGSALIGPATVVISGATASGAAITTIMQ